MSRVVAMDDMFSWALSFNQSLSKWDVSQVRAMDFMFYGAESFDQSLSEWNVAELVTCRSIVRGSGFTGSLLMWDADLIVSAAETVG